MNPYSMSSQNDTALMVKIGVVPIRIGGDAVSPSLRAFMRSFPATHEAPCVEFVCTRNLEAGWWGDRTVSIISSQLRPSALKFTDYAGTVGYTVTTDGGGPLLVRINPEDRSRLSGLKAWLKWTIPLFDNFY